MARKDAEAAAGVFGAQRQDSVFVDNDRQRRDNAQPHDGRSVLAAAVSFWRASSSVPTM